MAVSSTRFLAWQPRVLAILRIATGLLFLQHGTQKFLNFPPYPAGGVAPASLSLPWWAGVVEFSAGILMILGFFTRPVAFLASGTMAVAYFYVHAPMSFFPILNRGELAALYCFVFLYFSVAGSGDWSIDAVRRKKYATRW